MARAKTTAEPPAQSYMTTEQMDGADTLRHPQPDSVQVIGGSLTDEQHKMLHERMSRGIARRLYEVWVTAGQLSGDKWDWANQSTRSQQAWVAVARATMGPAYQEQFGAPEIARLMHG
jgi:hypothetical protein